MNNARLSTGLENNPSDQRINYLQNALIAEEHKLLEFGIKIGILGETRSNYDIMLAPLEEEKEPDKIQLSESKKYERKSTKGITEDVVGFFKYFSSVHIYLLLNISVSFFCLMLQKTSVKIQRITMFPTELNLNKDFYMKPITISPRGYKAAREQGRNKWLIREIKRQQHKETDTYSVGTLLD